MSTVKQIRVGKNGSLLDIESVNDSQHANFATSTTLESLAERVTTLETTVGAIEVPNLTELNTKVAALEALNIQSTIEALVARIEALENGGGNQGGNTEPEPVVFVTSIYAGNGNYGNSADGKDQTQNQNKVEVSIENNVITLTANTEELESWASTDPNQGTNKWFALDFAFNPEKVNDLKWGVAPNQYNVKDILDGNYYVDLWLKLDQMSEDRIITISDATDPTKVETYTIHFVNTYVEPVVFVTDFHAGTANYGNSADGVNQRLNQDKLAISTSIENDITYVTLTGDVSLLTSWMSTNINQQDATHKWYGLDFVFDANKLENLTWNGSAIQNDWFDEPEGPNTITLWLKVDEVLNEEKTVTLSNGTDTQTIKVRIVNTFEAKTYGFTSYSDANGGNENIWATGTVVTTGNSATFSGVNYVEAEVTNNTIEGWVGRAFYIPANAQTDGTIYQLHNANGELVGVWVSITE